MKDILKLVHEPATIEGVESIITSSMKQFIGLILLPDREQYKKEREYVPVFRNSDCSINEMNLLVSQLFVVWEMVKRNSTN